METPLLGRVAVRHSSSKETTARERKNKVWKQTIHALIATGLATSVLLLISCQTTPTSQSKLQEMVLYSNWSWGISIGYPSTWRYQEGQTNPQSPVRHFAAYFGVPYDAMSQSEQVTFASSKNALESPGSTGGTFAILFMRRVTMASLEPVDLAKIQGVTIEKQSLGRVGGYRALEAFISMEDSTGTQIKGYMALVQYRNATILLQALTPSMSWDKYWPIFNEMVKSVALE